MNALGIFRIGYQEPLIPGLNSLWQNEPIVTKWMLVFTRMALHGHSVTIQDECLWNFQNWISGTLNPWIISLVTKWTNCDQTTVGHCADPHGLFLGDPYKMNAFGILKIRPPRAEKIIPHPLTPVLALCARSPCILSLNRTCPNSYRRVVIVVNIFL